MKLAFLTFACDAVVSDEATCGEESPHYPTWAEARREARADGWWLGVDGYALCPVHHPHFEHDAETSQ